MKILLAALPADGHFNPLTGIAVHLRDEGHDVRWYAGPRYGAKAERLGIPVIAYRRANEIMAADLNELFPERARLHGPRRLSFDLEKVFVANVEQHFLDISDLRDEFPFEVLLCDGAVYAERLVAECLGIPVVAVALSTVLPGPDDPPPFFGLRPARHAWDRLVHRVVRRMIAATNKRGVASYNEILRRHGAPPIAADGLPGQPMAELSRVLLNAAPGFEFPGYRPPDNAVWAGPLLPARPPRRGPVAELPAVITEATRPVVAVSQGTVDNTDPSKLIEPALSALCDGANVVVATTGGANTEALRRRFASPTVVIEDFIDYGRLFPYVDVFVSNGGFGSVLEAFCHGVPVVAAGTREGKNDNNARIRHNRLGVDLRTERPRPRQIAAAVESVLADPDVKGNVARLRDELASYDTMRIVDRSLEDAVSGVS